MKINNLIKAAIHNKELRDSLVKNPIRTCNNHGISIGCLGMKSYTAKAFSDQSMMQGGYRP